MKLLLNPYYETIFMYENKKKYESFDMIIFGKVHKHFFTQIMNGEFCIIYFIDIYGVLNIVPSDRFSEIEKLTTIEMYTKLDLTYPNTDDTLIQFIDKQTDSNSYVFYNKIKKWEKEEEEKNVSYSPTSTQNPCLVSDYIDLTSLEETEIIESPLHTNDIFFLKSD